MLDDLENIHLQRVKEYSFADKLSKVKRKIDCSEIKFMNTQSQVFQSRGKSFVRLSKRRCTNGLSCKHCVLISIFVFLLSEQWTKICFPTVDWGWGIKHPRFDTTSRPNCI